MRWYAERTNEHFLNILSSEKASTGVVASANVCTMFGVRYLWKYHDFLSCSSIDRFPVARLSSYVGCGDIDAHIFCCCIFAHLRQFDANEWNMECRIASHRRRHTYACVWSILKWILRRNGKWKWWWLCGKEFGTIFCSVFYFCYTPPPIDGVWICYVFFHLLLFLIALHSVRYAFAISQTRRKEKNWEKKKTKMMTWKRKRIQQKWNNISNRIEWFTVIERKENRKNGKRKKRENGREQSVGWAQERGMQLQFACDPFSFI